MARRLPAPAPAIAGYTYVRPLGSGGFADVYLYQQHMPRRTVAVKVLLPSVAGASAQRMFLAEATVMARMAAHPAVLTVYEANLSPDGRPYLVMEYCPTGYGERFREETIPLAEVLSVGIAIGSVLETAHRQGVLHRDIKPSNILITQYGRPVLADFGIASTVAEAAGSESFGLSIPWAAPEVISGRTGGTVRSEVWGFCATLYALLAGRSPFEVPGGARGTEAVQRRILSRETVKPTGRPDVPPELEAALARGLSKDPARRQGSILDVLSSLQSVENALGIRPSPIDIPPDVDPDAVPELTAPKEQSTSTTTPSGRRRRRRDSTHGTVDTSTGGSRDTALRAWDDGSAQADRKRRKVVIASSISAAVVVAGLGIAWLAGAFHSGAIPEVGAIQVSESGSVITFTWDDPGLQPGDTYLVRVNEQAGTSQENTEFTYDTRDRSDPRVCVKVAVVRDGNTGPVSQPKCAEP